MPFVTIEKTRHFYRLEGTAGKPVLVLAHSIGTDNGLWQPQIADLTGEFQVLRYDIRGHGASDSPAGEYSIEMLGRDLLGIANALKLTKFAFCGLSLGGAVGQWLAINAADRVSALILANTSCQFGPAANWDTRIRLVREGGMAAIADVAMGRFFSAETLSSGAACVGSIKSVLLATDAGGYSACCAALRDFDSRKSLAQIRVPTMVITGDKDVSTPWDGHGEILAREIPGAQAIRLAAAHLSNLEAPHAFTAAIFQLLNPKAKAENAQEEGMKVRRAVLGDEHVDRAIAATNDFTRDFQELITRYAWGSIWTRPGLDRRTRRLLVLATMAALGRWEEFTMHVRAGLKHGMEPCDLKELLLQVAVYAGVPAANTAFHIANEEIEKSRQKQT